MITNYPEYPQEQIEWLRNYYPTHSGKDTQTAFNDHFGLNLTLSQIKHRVQKFGIKTQHNGRFIKGNDTWNKGMNLKIERPDIYAQYISGSRTRFKKGDLPKNTKPIGSEYVCRGFVMVKVAMPNVWKSKSRYVYEQTHKCELQKSDVILHLDGNSLNCEADNLIKVNNIILARLNKQGLIFNNAELTKSAVYREQLLQKIKEIEGGDAI